MLNSDNKMTKYVGYLLIGFFLLIIILSFGMPDMGMSCGGDRYTFVKVNGESFNPIEFYKYKNLFYGPERNERFDEIILNNFIMDVLIYQRAEKEGIEFSDDRLSSLIVKSPEFINPNTGKYDWDFFEYRLRQFNLTLPEFEKIFKRMKSKDELFYFIGLGETVPSEEIKFKSFINGSKLQIRYAYLSNDELKKRFSAEIAVTEQEIDAEITSQNAKISDPKTDRERIRKHLEDKKLDKVKNDIIEKINALATSGGSFDAAAAILKGTVTKSQPFKIGEEIKAEGKDGKSAASISSSGIFMDRILVMNINSTSPVINAVSGLYIFTPVSRELPANEPDEQTVAQIRTDLSSENMNTTRRSFIMDLSQNSKIIKKSKTD